MNLDEKAHLILGGREMIETVKAAAEMRIDDLQSLFQVVLFSRFDSRSYLDATA